MQLPQNDEGISRNDRRHKLNLMVVENSPAAMSDESFPLCTEGSPASGEDHLPFQRGLSWGGVLKFVPEFFPDQALGQQKKHGDLPLKFFRTEQTYS
jgi:hypothetical protein